VAFIISGSCKFDASFRNNGLRAIILETTDLLDLLKCMCVQCVIARCPAEKKKKPVFQNCHSKLSVTFPEETEWVCL